MRLVLYAVHGTISYSGMHRGWGAPYEYILCSGTEVGYTVYVVLLSQC